MKEAKAAETRAKADAKVSRSANEAPVPAQTADMRQNADKRAAEVRQEAAEDKRDADYKVAREKCDALSGDAKDRCVSDAKARFGKS